jgi:hypothetical protein
LAAIGNLSEQAGFLKNAGRIKSFRFFSTSKPAFFKKSKRVSNEEKRNVSKILNNFSGSLSFDQ